LDPILGPPLPPELPRLPTTQDPDPILVEDRVRALLHGLEEDAQEVAALDAAPAVVVIRQVAAVPGPLDRNAAALAELCGARGARIRHDTPNGGGRASAPPPRGTPLDSEQAEGPPTAHIGRDTRGRCRHASRSPGARTAEPPEGLP